MNRRILLGLVALSCTSGSARAQLIRVHEGTDDYERLGHFLAFVGDTDGDGVEDYALGNRATLGRVDLHSGVDGALLWSHVSTNLRRIGDAVSRLGDLNGDGAQDVLVSISHDQRGVMVLSGTDGSILQETRDPAWSVNFGISVAGLGDVNADGVPDYVAVGEETTTPVLVISGIDGQVIWSRYLPARSVAALGDIDGDGIQELAVGHPRFVISGEERGRVQVLDGATGAIEYDHLNVAGAYDDQYGFKVASAGDSDGDGVPDYAIAAPRQDTNSAFHPAFVELRSGATGEVIRTIEGQYDQGFGLGITSVGDLDADGRDELMIADPGAWSVEVLPGYTYFTRIYSGASGLPLYTVAHHKGHGWALDASADIDGDGDRELLFGHRDRTSGDWYKAGRVELRHPEIMTDVVTAYCQSEANSSGSASRMDFGGSTSISANDFVLKASGTPENQFGIFYYGPIFRSLHTPAGWACILGSQYRMPPIAAGGVVQQPFDLQNPLPSHPFIQPGDTWYFQFWFRDPGTSWLNRNFSNALEVTFRF